MIFGQEGAAYTRGRSRLARRAVRIQAGTRAAARNHVTRSLGKMRMAEGVAFLARMKAEAAIWLNIFTDEDDALLAELGGEVEAKKVASRTPHEERIIAGFEEVQRFVEEHGRSPPAMVRMGYLRPPLCRRLDRLREQAECRACLNRSTTKTSCR